MQQEKLSIRFILRKSRINQKKKSPIYCRITYLKERKDFSTGEFIKAKNWNSKQQSVLNNSNINSHLRVIYNKLEKAYLHLQLEMESITVEDIYRKYKGKPVKRKLQVVEYYREYLIKLKKLIDIDLKYHTFKKYRYVCDHIEEFIRWKFKRKDIPLEQLNLQFLEDFDYYLKTQRNQRQVTINKEIQRFRKIVKTAYGEGIIDQNPFYLYKAKKVKTKIIYLDAEELRRLENQEFKKDKLKRVRDMFVFCCYTGLPYTEMKNLKPKHIVKGFDDQKWIKIKRQKTGGKLSIPLLSKAKALLYKFLETESSEYLLPRLSNQKFNQHLKDIAAITGIKKRLTHHTARKTFASTVLLYNDVPMEVVSELLGHSSLKITQKYYGKIIEKTVSDKMKDLDKRLK